MPVIVDEVVISVEVGNHASGGAAAPAATEDRQTVINECVERVLELLKQKSER